MSARILIIDDDVPSLALAQYILEAAGHRTTAANDGQRGAHLARTEAFDIILSDLHMPDLTGYEIVARLLADPGWRRIPLIAVTASSMIGDRESVLAAGFDGYISKPIAPETFAAEVARFLDDGPGKAAP